MPPTGRDGGSPRNTAGRPLRILFGGYSLAQPSGGGELSARSLLVRLSTRHDVRALCVGSARREYVLDGRVPCTDHPTALLPVPWGIPFHLAAMAVESRFRRRLARDLEQTRTDLVILQQPAHLAPGDLPAGTRLVVFVRSLGCFGAGDANPDPWRRRIGYPFRRLRLWRNRALLDRADLIVSNSHFLQRALAEGAGIDTEVVHPFIDDDRLRVPPAAGHGESLTFVGLDAWKGARVAVALAESLPDRHFLFLEGGRASPAWKARAGRLPNVTCLPWTDDMRPVFQRTRLLLMPSLWDEPFGRLPVEAGAWAIPTLASSRGGLSESVGEGGILIDPPGDVSRWLAAIREMDDPERYGALSRAAQRHATSFALDTTLARFGDLLRDRLGLVL